MAEAQKKPHGNAGKGKSKVDLSTLKIEHDTPVPGSRFVQPKYNKLFAELKVGSCIVCKKGQSSAISNAMRDWIKETGMKDVKQRAVHECADGNGRVWLVSTKGD